MARRRKDHETEQRDRQNIGERLRQKRREAGLTLAAVATLTGINISTLSRLEAGIYTLSVHRLKTLARVLHCEEHEFLMEPAALVESSHV